MTDDEIVCAALALAVKAHTKHGAKPNLDILKSVYLARCNGETYTEIAKRLGCTRQWVCTLYKKAKNFLENSGKST